MPVAATDFLDCACRLRKHGEEIDLRSAASRAYYALFHHARELARQELDFDDRKTMSVHQHLIDVLSAQGNRLALRKLAQMLRKTRSLRRIADYEENRSFSRRESQTALAHAEHGLNLT